MVLDVMATEEMSELLYPELTYSLIENLWLKKS